MAVPSNPENAIKNSTKAEAVEIPPYEAPVTVRMRDSAGAPPAPDRKTRIVRVIEVHRMPFLLPFGSTTIRVDRERQEWTGKCGPFFICGSGTKIEEIVKLFVNLAHDQVKFAKLDVCGS